MQASATPAPVGLATEDERLKTIAQAEANAKTALICTIINPGKRRQVIYDGIGNGAPIKFEPGETKTGIRLAEHMVVRLQEDENAGDSYAEDAKRLGLSIPDNPNLRVLDWAPAPPEAPRAALPPRKPRPARPQAA